jgi:hypothetical protein
LHPIGNETGVVSAHQKGHAGSIGDADSGAAQSRRDPGATASTTQFEHMLIGHIGDCAQESVESLGGSPSSCPERIEFHDAVAVLPERGFEQAIRIDHACPWVIAFRDPSGDMFDGDVPLETP